MGVKTNFLSFLFIYFFQQTPHLVFTKSFESCKLLYVWVAMQFLLGTTRGRQSCTVGCWRNGCFKRSKNFAQWNASFALLICNSNHMVTFMSFSVSSRSTIRHDQDSDEDSEDPALMIVPGSSKSVSGVSRYRDFIGCLPVDLSKRILGESTQCCPSSMIIFFSIFIKNCYLQRTHMQCSQPARLTAICILDSFLTILRLGLLVG